MLHILIQIAVNWLENFYSNGCRLLLDITCTGTDYWSYCVTTRYPHIAKDHLVKLLKQLMLNGKHEGSSPNAADVPTLLGDGSFSLLDST